MADVGVSDRRCFLDVFDRRAQPVLVEFVEQHKDKLVALTDLPMEAEGQKNGKAVVIQKGNDDLTQVVNEAIEALKTSGELDEIIKHYTSKAQEEISSQE